MNYDTQYENNYQELYLEPDTSNPADLAVDIDGPNDPDLGESFTYEIEVTNHGPQQAHDVDLHDSLPFGVDVESWDSSAGADACELVEEDPYQGTEDDPETMDSPAYVYRELVCAFGSLAPDETVTVDIEVERNDPYELWNNVWVTTSSYDENYENDYDYTTTQAHESVRSDVSIELFGPATVPLVGDRFDIVYRVGNSGPAPARDAWLAGFLPVGLEYESASSTSGGVDCSSNSPDGSVSGGGGDSGGGTIEPAPAPAPTSESGDDMAKGGAPAYYGGDGFNCALGTMSPGQSMDVTVTVVRTKAMEMWPTASLWSSSVDPDYEDNYGELRLRPDTSHPADVSIGVSGPEDAEVGDQVTYELTATNNGPLSALSVELVDALPFGLDFVDASAADPDAQCGFSDGDSYPVAERDAAPAYWGYRELRCALGNMKAGESTTVTLTATRNSEYEIWNSAYVSSSSYDENPDNDYGSTKLDGEPYPCGPGPLGGDGKDDIVAGPCPVASGAGNDSVVAEAGAGRAVKVRSGGGRDSVIVNIPSGPQTKPVRVATGPGRDRIVIVIAPGATGIDVVVRGGGRADSIEVNGAARRGVLKLKGGKGADSVMGNDGVELLLGGYGNDILDGGAGDDILRGGPGRDTCQGGPGTDTTDCS
jgi:uncharacterized repeat protein (TIGR01451 family)